MQRLNMYEILSKVYLCEILRNENGFLSCIQYDTEKSTALWWLVVFVIQKKNLKLR